MIKMDDYRDAEGRLQWDKYEAAQRACGDRCYHCGAYIVTMHNHGGGKRKCYSCNCLANQEDESVYHSELVRCPHCLHQQPCPGDDNYLLYEDGEHDFWCGECDEKFTVVTHVSYEFESPITDNNLPEDTSGE